MGTDSTILTLCAILAVISASCCILPHLNHETGQACRQESGYVYTADARYGLLSESAQEFLCTLSISDLVLLRSEQRLGRMPFVM